jgi:predicted NBD/HSP70 family sugar kinase
MERTRGRGPTLAKDINRKLVYQQIKQKRSTSRVEIAKLLHLNKNTVNSIVDELIDASFVQELGQLTTNNAGRKPILISFNASVKWSIGVQITSTVIHWAVTDLYAKPIESFSVPLEVSTPDMVADALTSGINRLTSKYSLADCIGMCLGVPGLIASDSGKVIRSSHLGWHDVPILSLLKNRMNINTRLENSVKLASLGELWHGSGHGLENFIYCYFGNGVACSIIANGSIVRGEINAAGELGHMIIDPQGPKCGCGNIGCLEAMVSLPTLLQRVSNKVSMSKKDVTLEWVLAELASGHPAVQYEFEQIGQYIGEALSYVTNLLNPKLIICDGPLMQASSYLFPIIEEVLNRRCVSITADQVSLTRSKLYPLASCIGAAASIIQSWEEGFDSFEQVT